MLKVRYHLQKGPYYMNWQFKDTETGNVFYHKPSDHVIKIHNCILHNNRRVADKIYLGSNKDVCAWIKFAKMEIMPNDEMIPDWYTRITYNPKTLPYWHTVRAVDGVRNYSENLDGTAFDELYLSDKGVFFNTCRKICNPLSHM